MDAHKHEVFGVVLISVGGGVALASGLHSWLLKSGFRVSPIFKTVTAQEGADAERRGGVVRQRLVKVMAWTGGVLICCGVAVLAL